MAILPTKNGNFNNFSSLADLFYPSAFPVKVSMHD